MLYFTILAALLQALPPIFGYTCGFIADLENIIAAQIYSVCGDFCALKSFYLLGYNVRN